MNKKYQIKRKALPGMLLLLVIAVSGVMYLHDTWVRFEKARVREVFQIAGNIEAMLPKADLKTLEAKPCDIDKPGYQVIKNTLKTIIRINPKARFAYIYTERNGKIYFMADSEPEDSKDYSPPGQEYTEAKPEIKLTFRDGKAHMTALFSDRWGTWESILIPVRDEVTGRTIAIFGMDFSAKARKNFLIYKVVESGVLILILLLTFLLLKIRTRNKSLSHDIIERKRAEQALGESELRFQTLAQISPVGIFRTDAGGATTYVTPNWCQISGLPAAEAMGDGWLRAVHADDRVKLTTKWSASIQNNSSSSAEYRFVRADGSVAWVIGQAVQEKNAEGEIVGYVGTITDISERIRAEKSLRESERNKSVLLSNLPGIAYRCQFNHDWTMEFVSQGFINLTGYERTAIINNREISFNDIILPEYREYLWKAWEKAVLLHGTVCEEYRILTADNREKWVWEQGIPVYNAKGEVEALEGLIIDITSRKQIEQALKESDEKHRILFMDSPDAYLIIIDGIFVDCNRAARFMMRGDRSQIIGQKPEILSPEFQPGGRKSSDLAAEKINEAFLMGNNSFEWVHRRFDGTEFSVEVSVALMKLDGKATLFTTWRDITARRQAEQAMIKGKEQYDNLVSKIPVGIYILRSKPDGSFVLDYVSPRMAEILNLKIENLITATQTVFHAIHPDDVDGFLKLNREGIELKRPFDWKGRVLVRGTVRWLHFQSSPEPAENGDILWNGLIIDITDRKLAEEEINILTDELEQRVRQRTLQLENTNRELEAFSYSVSHDLRSPLRGIDGWSMALLEDYSQLLDEQGRGYLGRVRSEAQRMGYLIDDMLKLSRVTRAEMKSINVDMTTLVQTIVARLTQAEPQRQFEFIVEPGIIIPGDQSLLEIALTNLLDNACKFTGRKPVAQIAFGKAEIDGKPTFFIRDNGVGFNMSSADSLFGAFQRMHKQSDFPGSGIGLATVQRIISRHGGRIWAESKPGEGSTFFFTLN